jgi:succinate dehydrogenase / fumarate reductase cytochrome b subunit
MSTKANTMSHNRPLSPHLQVYRLPLTGLVSITHRVTGVCLSLGLLLFTALLGTIVWGENAYVTMQTVMQFWISQLIFWAFVYALFFHLCHGIRHLIWDMGETFERTTLDRFAIYELIATASLTLTTYIIW